MAKLCVNIDHVATIRNARGESEPDPVHAAVLCELAGATGITFHLREDRRHIRDDDVFALHRATKGLLNMEMACTDEMVKIALKLKPGQVTIVPEKRQELTTEGGLDVRANKAALKKATKKLGDAGIAVSYFIGTDPEQVALSAELGATHVEFHTGSYCRHYDRERNQAMVELEKLETACILAHGEELVVNAGHGVNYRNVIPIAQLPFINELNIGHAIVGRAVFVGMERAVSDMIHLIEKAHLMVDEE